MQSDPVLKLGLEVLEFEKMVPNIEMAWFRNLKSLPQTHT
jgi:hypothetical protein